MFRQSIRQFGTTALRAAESSTYGVRVSQAQGVVNGLTEGTTPMTIDNTGADRIQPLETRPLFG